MSGDGRADEASQLPDRPIGGSPRRLVSEQDNAEGEAPKRRPLIRRLKANSAGTVDAIRDLLAIPDGAGSTYWSAAVLGLVVARVIRGVEFTLSIRAERRRCRTVEGALVLGSGREGRGLQNRPTHRNVRAPGEGSGAA